MYTDDDLDAAIEAHVLDRPTVERFRVFIAQRADSAVPDQEHFRLLTGFNDIFVSIAAFVLLLSASWLSGQASALLGFLVCSTLAWLLSVPFIKRKRLALPSLLLLGSFVAGIVGGVMVSLVAADWEKGSAMLVACLMGAVAAWMHWQAFKVPVTFACGVATLVGGILFVLNQYELLVGAYLNIAIFMAGLITFALAMYWDMQDTARLTGKSDVAFWLHLMAAPLIVHPVFSALGSLEGASMQSVFIVMGLYALLGAVSLIVDRRALMVSALVYVIYALKHLFDAVGALDLSLAFAGVVISAGLLWLSAYWYQSRQRIMQWVPAVWVDRLPAG